MPDRFNVSGAPGLFADIALTLTRGRSAADTIYLKGVRVGVSGLSSSRVFMSANPETRDIGICPARHAWLSSRAHMHVDGWRQRDPRRALVFKGQLSHNSYESYESMRPSTWQT
jgi:hypothetical protein